MPRLPVLSRLRASGSRTRPPRPSPRLLGIALVAVSVLGLLALWLRDSSVVAVKEVAVRGVSGPRAQAVRTTLTEAARDMTTLHVDSAALRDAVAGHPIVEDVRVDRDLPDALTVTVVERAPVAALATPERRLAVAADGTLLPGHPTAGLATVPIDVLPTGRRLRGGAQRTAVGVLAAMPRPLRERARRAGRVERGWAVALRDGPVVHLGSPARLRAKWAAAAAVVADPGARGAAYVDVRLPERPTAGGLAPLPGAADAAAPADDVGAGQEELPTPAAGQAQAPAPAAAQAPAP